jgi:hypothetical protein
MPRYFLKQFHRYNQNSSVGTKTSEWSFEADAQAGDLVE